MRQTFVAKKDKKSLLILFAGWGADYGYFKSISLPGHDIMVVWDYSDCSFDFNAVNGYTEIVVVAWSFGAIAASHLLSDGNNLPITMAIAINSTLNPDDDHYGIPHSVFQGTLDNLDEHNLTKFYRRMAGSTELFKEFIAKNGSQTISSLKIQLELIRDIAEENLSTDIWDIAFVADDDRIIPTQNQISFWTDHNVETTLIKGSHLSDIQHILDKTVRDKAIVARHFATSSSTYDKNACIQQEIARHVVGMISSCDGNILEIGCGTGILSRTLLDRFGEDIDLTLIDLNAGEIRGRQIIAADGETYLQSVPDNSIDIIVSTSTIQWFNSPRRFLLQCLRVLKYGGHAYISTFGSDTFRELSGIAPTLPFMTPAQWRSLIPKPFREADITDDCMTLSFADGTEVLRHMKLTGVNSVEASDDRLARMAAIKIIRHYPTDTDGRCKLTYNPIYIKLIK